MCLWKELRTNLYMAMYDMVRVHIAITKWCIVIGLVHSWICEVALLKYLLTTAYHQWQWYVGSCLSWCRISTAYVISVLVKDTKSKHVFLFSSEKNITSQQWLVLVTTSCILTCINITSCCKTPLWKVHIFQVFDMITKARNIDFKQR